MITMEPVGVVRSPFTDTAEIPKGPGARHGAEGVLEVRSDLEAGLTDIDGFSHLYLLWVFDRAKGFDALFQPPTDDRPHGVFATRSPRRPNPIGLTVVELLGREGPRLRVRGVDMLDRTPILDIKPYLSSVPIDLVRRGWLAEAEARRAASASSTASRARTGGGVGEVWPGGMPTVGERARRSRVVADRDIELFTAISGDRNPLHYDEETARRSRFGGIVVQGGVTTAILNAVVAEDLPGPGSVFLHVDWNFRAPVRPGDTITGEVTVTGVRQDKPITMLETRVLLADGTVVLDGTAVCYTMPIATG